MVERCAYQHVHNALLPLPPSVDFTKHGKEMEEILSLDNPYRSLVGSLNHLSQRTRPNITFAMSLFSRFLIVYGTADGMTGWTDASYAKGPDNKWTTMWVLTLYGGAVT